MDITIYKHKAIKEKMFNEGMAYAEIMMRQKEKQKMYFGDKNIVKIQRHTGEMMYQIKEETLKELMRFVYMVENSCREYVLKATHKHELTPKQNAAMEFFASLSMKNEYRESIEKCIQGSPIMSFWRDKEALELAEKIEREKRELLDEWSW